MAYLQDEKESRNFTSTAGKTYMLCPPRAFFDSEDSQKRCPFYLTQESSKLQQPCGDSKQ